ncbi:hypothetical protein ACQUW5_09075 [Legionella sp. CNM-1927-20]|uniref:hypothetical protein n=1 Tax=Legionella sp. CNM-1927-20 TaxID=3422221 RepID=UPI00403A87F1
MALFKFRTPDRNFIKNNWKTISATSLALLAAVGVGVTCAFFPPAIPFIAGLSFFGFKAFAGLSAMSVIAASFSSAGIAAAAVVAGSAIVNALTKVSNLLDNLFRTKKTHITDFKREEIVVTGSPYSSRALGSKSAKVSILEEEEPLLRTDKSAKIDTSRTPGVTVTPNNSTSTSRIEDLGTSSNQFTFHQPVPAEVKTNVTVKKDSELVVGEPTTTARLG